MGPFNEWPSAGGGFEYFSGFIGGEDNQWGPALYEGTNPVEPPKSEEEGYHLTDDLTDKAVSWIHQQKALMPGLMGKTMRYREGCDWSRMGRDIKT